MEFEDDGPSPKYELESLEEDSKPLMSESYQKTLDHSFQEKDTTRETPLSQPLRSQIAFVKRNT